MKKFATKIEWYPNKSGHGKYGMPLWRLGEYGLAHVLVLGSKRDEDYVLRDDYTPEEEQKVFLLHIKDLAIRLKRLGFKAGKFHGKEITLAGALGASTILGLTPLDFIYVAHIDKKNDPGQEFWDAVAYTNDLEIDFD